MKTRILLIVSLVALTVPLVYSSGCGRTEATPSPIAKPLPTNTVEPSPTPQPTDTPPPTATPTPTATPQPTVTAAVAAASVTPAPTSTAQPTTSSGGGSGDSQPVMTPEMQALVDQLVHGDEAAREAAAQQIAAMGPQAAAAMPALIQALSDQSADVRTIIAQVLQALGPQAMSAVPALIQSLGSSSGQTGEAVAAALKSVTGQDFGLDAARWQQWWQGQQATAAADSAQPGSGAPLEFPMPTGLDGWERVDDAYRVTIIVHITGGTAPFVVRHDMDSFVTTERAFPLVFTASGCTIVHTIAVDSSDGQSVSHSYYINSPWCD